MVSIILWATGAILALGLLPAAWVLLGKLRRRRSEGRRREGLEAARRIVDDAQTSLPAKATALAGFDALTIEQALAAAVRAQPEDDPGATRRLADLSQHFGLAERAIVAIRSAPSWSERADAADLCGRLGAVAAVPALIAALRDPYEDAASVKAAAARALARVQSPEAIPFLVDALKQIDEHASPRIAEALVAFGPAAVPALLALLGGEEGAGTTAWAVRIMGRIGDPGSGPALIDQLRHRQDIVRVAAAEALGALGHLRASQPLIDAALRDPAPHVRAHAAAALGKLGDENAVEVLVAALADPDYGTRMRAAEALEMLRPRDTAPLERALRDANQEVRRRAALALDRLGFFESRLAGLVSDDREVSRAAYGDLMQLGRAGLADRIAAAVHHDDFRVRAQLVRVCGELGETRLGPLLLDLVDDPSWPVRARLAETLGRLRPPEAAGTLARLLADAEVVVRESAAEALAGYGKPELKSVYPKLVEAFERGTMKMRVPIVEIFARLDDEPDTQVRLLKVLEDPNEAVRLRALRALAERRAQVDIAPLVAQLSDPSLAVRLTAVDAIGAIEAPSAIDALLMALPGATLDVRDKVAGVLAQRPREQLGSRIDELVRADDLDVRLGISWTLGKTGDPSGIPILAGLLRNSEPRLRASAAGALGKIRHRDSVTTLLAAVSDRDARTRAAVVNALCRQTPHDEEELVIETLVRRLADPDAFVRNRVAIALGCIGGAKVEEVLVEAETATLVDESMLTLAIGLLGSSTGISRTMEVVSDPPRFAKLNALLEREDEAVRRMFFQRLHLQDPNAAPVVTLDETAIIEQYHRLLLHSQSEGSRGVAVEALAKLAHPRTLETLADALATDPSEEIRRMAAEALARTPDEDVARRALRKSINDPSLEVSVISIRAAARGQHPSWGEALFKRLRGQQGPIEDEVVESLAELHRSDPLPFVDRMMGEARPAVLISCLRVLELLANPKLAPLLTSHARAREAPVRAAAVAALAVLPPNAEVTAALDEARFDTDESVRLGALAAVANRHDSEALPRTAAFRTDPSQAVRMTVAWELGRFADSEATAALVELAADPIPEVAAVALGTLLAPADEGALRHFGRALARCAPEALARLRTDARAEEITGALGGLLASHRSVEVRELAVAAVAALAHGDFERHLLACLQDPAPSVRVAAVRALTPLDRAGVRERLRALLDDPDLDVREAVKSAKVLALR